MSQKQWSGAELYDRFQAFMAALGRLIEQLAPEERSKYSELVQQGMIDHIRRALHHNYQSSDLFSICEADARWWAEIGAQATGAEIVLRHNAARQLEEEVISRFTPKPRMTERDATIVRLRDEEHLKWSEIRKQIRANAEWAKGRDDKPITLAALKAAYRRYKEANKQSNSLDSLEHMGDSSASLARALLPPSGSFQLD
jgi:hypothetical protein